MFPTLFSLEIPFLDLTLEPRFYGLFYAIAILIGSPDCAVRSATPRVGSQ